jgi:hypothetical protein
MQEAASNQLLAFVKSIIEDADAATPGRDEGFQLGFEHMDGGLIDLDIHHPAFTGLERSTPTPVSIGVFTERRSTEHCTLPAVLKLQGAKLALRQKLCAAQIRLMEDCAGQAKGAIRIHPPPRELSSLIFDAEQDNVLGVHISG